MAYVNGEWTDDDPNQEQSPMAGLTSTSTPNRGTAQAASPFDDPNWTSQLNTQGLGYDKSFLEKVGRENNLTPEMFNQGYDYYNKNITPFAGNSNWWGQEAMNRVPLQGISTGGFSPGFDFAKYNNSALEQSQQKTKADEEMAKQRKNGGDDFFGSLLPLLVVGGLGLATGGFGFGAGAGAFAGADTAAGLSAADALIGAGGAEALGGGAAAAFDPLAVGGADWMGEIAAGAGNGGSTLGDLYSGAFDQSGASNFFGTGEGNSATNLEQALNSPQTTGGVTPAQQDALNNIKVDSFTSNRVGDVPAGLDSASKYGLDSTGANMKLNGPGLNNLYGTPGNSGSLNGLNPGAQSYLGNTPVNVSQAAMNPSGFKMNDIFKIMQSPEFQLAKTGYNVWNQGQKASALKDMFNQFKQQSDVGGPFRQQLMASYTDPNFFNNMPEFKAGMDAFNQQYAANAAKSGQRSNLGGAAHNIAVNRENARLADIYRGRLSGPASMAPQTSGMAAIAAPMLAAQGNQFNSLLDPNLWKAVQSMGIFS